MESRKLIQFGKNSHVISLPKAWLVSNNVKKGDELLLEEKAGSIIIQTSGQVAVERRATIILDHHDMKLFQTELTGLYKAGCDTIIIDGSSLREHGEEVKEMVHWLAGLEIVDQTLDTIVVKDLIDIKQITLPTLLNRMDMMVRSLFHDILREPEVPNKMLRERDKDINRLQFLVARVVRKILLNPALGNILGVRTDQAYFTDKIAWALERIGDCIKRGDDDMLRCAAKTKKQLKGHFSKMSTLYLTTLKCYNKLDQKQALKLHEELEHYRNEYTNKVRGAKSHNEVLALENVKNICRELKVVSQSIVELGKMEEFE